MKRIGMLTAGGDDREQLRQPALTVGNLMQPHHSINRDLNQRLRCLPAEAR